MRPDKIIVHCSASEWGCQSIIDGWHRARGWKQCGYQIVIPNGYVTHSHYELRRAVKLLDGTIEVGRPLDADADLEAHEMGAHCYGYNDTTLSICLVGDDRFTRNQVISMVKVVKWWQREFGVDTKNVVGHYEMPTAAGKTCPNLDMDTVRRLIVAKTDSMDLLAALPNLKEVR
jgi:hypothetical protein